MITKRTQFQQWPAKLVLFDGTTEVDSVSAILRGLEGQRMKGSSDSPVGNTLLNTDNWDDRASY